MIKKLITSHKIIFAILILVVASGIVFATRGKDSKNNGQSSQSSVTPVYLSFEGNYTFDVPKSHIVDEQSVPGAQLVYAGQINAKTLEDVYTAGGISLHPLSDLTDHSGKAFKDYVNDHYVPELKKNLSSNDVQVNFDKQNGQDVVRIDLKKEGKAFRHIYLKGGEHPAGVIAKQDSSTFRGIEQTLRDVEKSDIKNEVTSIKQAVQSAAQLIKAQKAHDFYVNAAPELRTKNSEAELTSAMKTAKPYSDGNITVSGVSYIPNEFSAAIRFTKLDKNDQQPGYGEMNFKKLDGQWKVQTVSLPTPKTT
jgi:hypothetical protein